MTFIVLRSTGFIDNLLCCGLEFNYVDNQGQSLLDWAAAYGTSEVVEKIVSQISDPNLEDALGFAVAFGRRSVCDILLKAGANPHLPLANGMSPIELARAMRCEAIIGLLEGGGLPLDPLKRCLKRKPAVLPIYRNEECGSGERSLFILAKEMFLVLSDTFERTQSEAMKYRSFSILLQLVRRLSPKSLEILSQNRCDFRLCHMIRVALAQETIKIVRCAFQLSHELLQKAEGIYRPLMYKHGIIPLMEIINAMLRLPHFHFKRNPMNCHMYYEDEEAEGSYSDVETADSRVCESEEQCEDREQCGADGGFLMVSWQFLSTIWKQ